MEQNKLIRNSVIGFRSEIKVKGQKLSTVTCFKYLEADVLNDGSKPVVLSKTSHATAALTTRLAGKYRWRKFPVVITVQGNTPIFAKWKILRNMKF